MQSAPVEAASNRVGSHGQQLAMPNFKVYFDLDLILAPGITNPSPFTFTNYHGFLFFEINESYGEQTVELLKSKSFYNIDLRKDISGRDRMIKASF